MNERLFRKDPVGVVHALPAGALLLCAGAMSDENDFSEGRERAGKLLAAVLAAARAGGYRGADVAETVLAGRYPLRRRIDCALEVCDHVGRDAYLGALRAAGFDPGGE